MRTVLVLAMMVGLISSCYKNPSLDVPKNPIELRGDNHEILRLTDGGCFLFFGTTDMAPLAICRNGEIRTNGRLIAEDQGAFRAICGVYSKTMALARLCGLEGEKPME